MNKREFAADPALFPSGGILEALRDHATDEWRAYLHHPFVEGLADGSLPEACFRHYLAQDYLFLIHFARAYALAAYKSESLSDIRNAVAACAAIVDVEMGLHVEFCRGWGLTEAEMENTLEDTATLSYTRYVLERGLAGDVLDLQVALAPCVLGYAEIGAALSKEAVSQNPYAAWIEMYAGDEYQQVARDAAAHIENLAAQQGGRDRLDSLKRTFSEATRLEIAFWEQGLAAEKN